MKKILLIFVMVSIFLGTWACQKMTPEDIEEGELTRLTLSEENAIPAEYGKLISATSVIAYPNIIQLWFEDSVGTIRMVRVGYQENRIFEEALIIPRN